MPKFVFKFISGKYQGGEFPVPNDGELLIGRASDLDMVLVEDMVSRKHAKLVCDAGVITLFDLGSTNGTFVNGEKIQRIELKKNDRVLIGTSILKLMVTQEMRAAGTEERVAARAMMDEIGKRSPASTTMSGDLEEVPLPDLLQLFATNKKTGTLTLGGNQSGNIYLREGMLLYSEVVGEEDLQPLKALCRMLNWGQGTFQFDSQTELPDVPVAFDLSTENILIEAMRQNDEAKRLLQRMPALDSSLKLIVPMKARLADLSQPELDVLQLCINWGRMRSVLDKAPMTDNEVLTHLQRLLDGGYVIPGGTTTGA